MLFIRFALTLLFTFSITSSAFAETGSVATFLQSIEGNWHAPNYKAQNLKVQESVWIFAATGTRGQTQSILEVDSGNGLTVNTKPVVVLRIDVENLAYREHVDSDTYIETRLTIEAGPSLVVSSSLYQRSETGAYVVVDAEGPHRLTPVR